MLEEGWYLMSVPELEQELKRLNDPEVAASDALRLSVEEAIAFRDAGNVPDDHGRSLRLVLHVRSAEDLRSLSRRRLLYEPDFHEEPSWRREGSLPINVVPYRLGEVEAAPSSPWWDEPEVRELETEWASTGTVAGIKVPADYRSFVYKTVLSLRAAGRDVSIETIHASVARWLSPEDAAQLRDALEEAQHGD